MRRYGNPRRIRTRAAQAAAACVGGFSLLGAVSPAAADDVLQYGAYLASECTTCHRLDGADKGIPPIIGWPEPQFVAVLRAYRDGVRVHAIMQNVARSLSEDEFAALARYFNHLGTGG